jgi:hypothetical protein
MRQITNLYAANHDFFINSTLTGTRQLTI